MKWIQAMLPGSDPKGKPVLSVLAKRTYTIAHQQKPVAADKQVPLYDADVYVNPDAAMYSEVLAESDMVAYKSSTDLVVRAKAHAPKGKRAYHLDCTVATGPYKKTVRVLGARHVEEKAFRGLTISDPEPFTEIEIAYTNAYGGTATSKNGTCYSYYPNPIGKGFNLKGAVDDVSTIVVPNLEDEQSPVTADTIVLDKAEDWIKAPKPASFGWTRKNFYPRYTWCGVLPEHLEAAMANVERQKKENPAAGDTALPRMDYRFFQGASDGFWGKRLAGDEMVRLGYMDERFPVFEFPLPAEYPVMSINVGNGPVALTPSLQTVVVDKENNLLSMLWCGSMEYGGLDELAVMKKLEVKVE